MSNLDDSIGKLLLELQKDDPDTFKKLMKRAQEENPELFEVDIDEESKQINKYDNVDEHNKKINED